MADFFSGEIAEVKLADIDDFLGLSTSEAERPPEGTRIDYKESLPNDIGDTVAALSNTDGGLIFIGVKADKHKQNVPVARDGSDLGNDAKARITNRILATVQPRPVFDIAVVPLPPSTTLSKSVAVIRVQAGPFPPYEFSLGGTVKIPVRIQDSNRQASLRQIEHLQQRRAAMSAPAEEIVSRYLGERISDLYLTDATDSREEQFQLALVVPRVSTSIRMDAVVHREFERLIRIPFTKDTQFNRHLLKGRYFEVEQRNFDKPTFNRAWRIWADGSTAMVESLIRRGTPTTPVESLGDFVLSLLRFFKLTSLCFERWNRVGPTVVFHFLSSGPIQFLPHFPKAFDPGTPHEVDGIQFSTPRFASIQQSRFYQETDVASLATPQELTAEIVLAQFQEVTGASIRFENLLFAVKRMFADFGLA